MSNTRKPTARKAAANKPDVAAILESAKRAEKTVELCLRGDLVAQVEELDRQLRASNSTGGDRLVGNVAGRKIAQQIAALQADMRDATIVVRLRAMPRREFQKFIAEHGPRDGNAEDRAAGVNVDTYFDELIKACAVAPELTEAQWDQLLDAVNTRQWNDLRAAASDLNTERVTVPFSAAASLMLPTSDAK